MRAAAVRARVEIRRAGTTTRFHSGDDAESRDRRAEELRSEDRLDEAREERAKATARRRVAENDG